MAITRIGVELVQSTSKTSSASITIPADCTLVLLGISADGVGATYSPDYVKINSVGMSYVWRASGGGYCGAWMYLLPNPATGSQTFSWDWTTTTPTEGVSYMLVYLKGADLSGTIYRAYTYKGDGAGSVAVTTQANDKVYGVVYNYNAVGDAEPAGSGQEQIIDSGGVYNAAWGAIGEETASGASTTFSFTGDALYCCAVIVSLIPAAGPPPEANVLFMTFES